MIEYTALLAWYKSSLVLMVTAFLKWFIFIAMFFKLENTELAQANHLTCAKQTDAVQKNAIRIQGAHASLA